MRNILQDPRNALWEYEKYKVVSRGPNLLLTISQQQSTKTTTSLQQMWKSGKLCSAANKFGLN